MGLAVSVALDVRSVRPNQPTHAHLVIVLTATRDAERDDERRAPTRTVLAIDASRSMHGEPLDHVKASVRRMVEMFAPEDEVGVVAFSDSASEVCPPTRMDEAGKRLVRERVTRLGVSANTNIEAGLEMAASLLANAPAGARRGAVLLSDGAPNRGAHTADGLREVAKRHRPGISFFALGYGRDHSEDVLSAVGEAGGGGYEYVPDPATCSRAFARALGAQADVVASGIEVVIGLADGVEIARFIGREETRFGKGGVIVSVPDMVAGARRVIVAQVTVAAPGSEKFLARIADVAVRASARTASIAKAEAVDVEVADREPVVDAAGAREVLLARVDLTRDDARKLADASQFDPAARLVRKLLGEIERCPGFVMNDGSVLAEAYEQLVDEAVAYERKPAFEEYKALRKTTMGFRFTASSPESARDRGPMSTRFLEGVAGDMPEAYLVMADRRHRLREENVLGRTQGADVVLTCAEVTRRHAGINCVNGRFVIVDYGSTNTTQVNGVPVRMHVLKDGDVIRVGTIEMRYEEKT